MDVYFQKSSSYNLSHVTTGPEITPINYVYHGRMGEEVRALIRDMGMHNEKQTTKQTGTCFLNVGATSGAD